MSSYTFAAVSLLLGVILSGCGGPAPVVGGRCLARLDSDGVAYRSVNLGEPRDSRCQVDTAVQVSRVGAALNHAATMSCPLASRLDAFERGAVQKLAAADLGQRVTRIDHLGAYSCRRSTGHHGKLSEHAYGLAIDISGFRLSDGTRISVAHDWSTPGPKRNFLLHLARAACGYFSVVLTPNSNREHFNHMHFDIGPDRLCSV
jgi:hypothetical protein